MKKNYVKPMVEIETYELSASIAANCQTTVNLGPEALGIEPCPEFEKGFDVVLNINPGYSTMSTGGKPFYSAEAGDCDCYYSSGGYVYLTS